MIRLGVVALSFFFLQPQSFLPVVAAGRVVAALIPIPPLKSAPAQPWEVVTIDQPESGESKSKLGKVPPEQSAVESQSLLSITAVTLSPPNSLIVAVHLQSFAGSCPMTTPHVPPSGPMKVGVCQTQLPPFDGTPPVPAFAEFHNSKDWEKPPPVSVPEIVIQLTFCWQQQEQQHPRPANPPQVVSSFA
jgi:hypothetical protein